jgi:hypothetical protein
MRVPGRWPKNGPVHIHPPYSEMLVIIREIMLALLEVCQRVS